MSPPEIDYCCEGNSDNEIARRLILAVNSVPGRSYTKASGARGKSALDRMLAGLNAGSTYGNPVFVLRDLDQDADCPSDLITVLLPERSNQLLLRIAVRSADAWLMADRSAYAKFCGLKETAVPAEPEREFRPKALLEGWIKKRTARKFSKFAGEQERLGMPLYQIIGQWQAEFARSEWNPRRAASSGASPSLARALQRLGEISQHSKND